MNCEEVRKSIDLLVFESEAVDEGVLKSHLGSCESCGNYYQAALKGAKLIRTLQENEPQLEYPADFTSEILAAIETEKQNISTTDTVQSKVIRIAVRLLAAASVLLFLTFGFEQYLVLEKVQKLELTSKTIVAQNTTTPSRQDLLGMNTSRLRYIIQRTGIDESDKNGLLALLSNGKISSQDLISLQQFRHLLPANQVSTLNLLKRYN